MASDATEVPCVLGVYCRRHGFVHGSEAEELRERIEALVEDDRVNVATVRRVLDRVDARDSLAVLEVRAARPRKAKRK